MDRLAAIGQLAQGIGAATARQDWAQLAAHERALPARLAQLGAAAPWNAAEREALARLRALHGEAAAACDRAAQAFADRLEEMRNNKDGWIAYTLENETGHALK